MPQLRDLKIMFGTGDLERCHFDYCGVHKAWTLYVYSKSHNGFLPLEAQRKAESGIYETRLFKTVDAALSEARRIGFKVDSLRLNW